MSGTQSQKRSIIQPLQNYVRGMRQRRQVASCTTTLRIAPRAARARASNSRVRADAGVGYVFARDL